jgi:hypothetical protein
MPPSVAKQSQLLTASDIQRYAHINAALGFTANQRPDLGIHMETKM